MKVPEFMRLDEIYLQVLREVAEEVAKPLSTVFEKLCQFDVVPSA